MLESVLSLKDKFFSQIGPAQEPWEQYTEDTKFSNEKRPFGGTSFCIIDSPYEIEHPIIKEARLYIGKCGVVRAWCPCYHGVDLGFEIPGKMIEKHVRVPYFMLELVEKKVS